MHLTIEHCKATIIECCAPISSKCIWLGYCHFLPWCQMSAVLCLIFPPDLYNESYWDTDCLMIFYKPTSALYETTSNTHLLLSIIVILLLNINFIILLCFTIFTCPVLRDRQGEIYENYQKYKEPSKIWLLTTGEMGMSQQNPEFLCYYLWYCFVLNM